jgi:hypothetical protein
MAKCSAQTSTNIAQNSDINAAFLRKTRTLLQFLSPAAESADIEAVHADAAEITAAMNDFLKCWNF